MDFYEKYWGGPTSPLGVWFGNEYNQFREALSRHLGIDPTYIKDCFFMKDDKGNYYIAPHKGSRNVYSSENLIPMEWFFLFSAEGRRELHSNWGFSALHYSSSISDSLTRLETAIEVVESVVSSEEVEKEDKLFSHFLKSLLSGLKNIYTLLTSHDRRGYVVLNYGDICLVIHSYSLKNERSVEEVSDFLTMLECSEFDRAKTFITAFNSKWDEIRRKCRGEEKGSFLQ